jgi:hypothetical protein
MRFGLILGDQLNHQLATLKYLNRNEDVILMGFSSPVLLILLQSDALH